MPHIYTVEYYSAIRKNEVMPFAATRMDLESVILSEVSQTEEEMPCNIPYMWSQRRNDANELNLQNRKRLTHLESKGNILESPFTVGKLKVKETKLSKVIQLGSGR